VVSAALLLVSRVILFSRPVHGSKTDAIGPLRHSTSLAKALPFSAKDEALPFSAAGRTVIVTGSSKGIGKGIARVFAKAGANVLVTSRHVDEAEAAAEEIEREGGVATAFGGDVSVEADAIAMAAFAYARYGGIDVLVANAGLIPTAKIEDIGEADWDRVIDVNLKGSFLSLKACLPYLKQSAFGRVVLTSSITGPITGFPGWAHYGASKAGQLGLMRSAAVELARHKITVNAVLPGNIYTETLAAYGPAFLEGVKSVIPSGEIGDPEDIGFACLYLASREAAFVTGQTLVLDGGQTVPETPDFAASW